LDTQAIILRAAKRDNLPFVFWLQDLIGTATKEILKTKLPGVGHMAGTYYTRLEERMLRQSDHIVLISPDFEPLLAEWGIAADRLSVIPNWAVLEEIPVMPKDNAWAQAHGLADKFCFLFTGVLGMKHNPGLLLELAQHFQTHPDVRVVVVSEGIGADWLRQKIQLLDVSNLSVYNFEPVERYAEVLASGDVLMTILQPEAGIYSVPSKVLSYLCAQRPLLLAIPAANLAARIVRQNQAGVVVSPAEFVQTAQMLYNDETLRNTQAAHGRAYAEQHFDIETICDEFEDILSQLSHNS
jgi:glycosyltransferase involved in cell wall biosynthesis